jgi:hypothetical protein
MGSIVNFALKQRLTMLAAMIETSHFFTIPGQSG